MAIIKMLLSTEEPITINKMSQEMNVSNSTIRNDLIKIEHMLLMNGLILMKNQGIGVWVNGSSNVKFEMLEKINRKNVVERVTVHSKEDRIKSILLRLLKNLGEFIRIESLSEEMFVSLSSIQKDLQLINKWVKKYDLKIERKRNNGVAIIGNEINGRKALVDLVLMKDTKEMLASHRLEKMTKIDHRLANQIKEMINIDIFKLEKIVIQAEQLLKMHFSDESCLSLIIHIVIAMKRIQDGSSIQNELGINDLEKLKEYKVATKLAKEIEEQFHVQFNEMEIKYLSLHLSGAKYIEFPTEELDSDLGMDNHVCKIIAEKIIELVERVCQVSFKDDKQFLYGLLIHLRPTINRLEYGMELKNPLLTEIKSLYPKAFGIACMANKIFEKYVGKKITEDEIGYIAIHIEGAIERISVMVNTIIVCSTGIGTAQLLATKIQKRFKQINIVHIMSYATFKSAHLEEIDLVISTIPIDTNLPFLIISPLLTVQDINRISSSLERRKERYDSKEQTFLKEMLVIRDKEFSEKKEVFNYVTSFLYEKGWVTNDYYDDLVKREEFNSTEIGKGVAIPHASLETIRETKLLIVMLKKPIKWDETNVDILVFVLINKKDIEWVSNILRPLYSRFSDDIFLQTIRENPNRVKSRIIQDLL